MGHMRHHAIVVTGMDFTNTGQGSPIHEAHGAAKMLFSDVAAVSEMTPEANNGYQSFFVAPDGSKESWPHSDDGDKTRDKFIDYLNSVRNTSCLDWVEVQYGDDDGVTKIVRHSDEDR